MIPAKYEACPTYGVHVGLALPFVLQSSSLSIFSESKQSSTPKILPTMPKLHWSLLLLPLLLCHLVVGVYAVLAPDLPNFQVLADKEDPSCTKDAGCKIGCCGPL